jgi:hypothetical protein
MRTEKLPNGSLVIQERWTLLRATCASAAFLLPVVVFLAASVEGSLGWQRLVGSALGSMLLLAIAAIVEDRRFVFDPSTRTMTWEQRNWFRSRGARLPFSDIKDVVVPLSRETDLESSRRRNHYTAMLVTTTGQIPLTATSSIRKQEYVDLADAVLAVLSRPHAEPAGETEIDRLVAAGYTIDAIALVRAQKGLGLAEARALVDKIEQAGKTASPRGRKMGY